MSGMLWPLILVVLSNILYNVASKSVPAAASPYLTLVATYFVAGVLSLAAYFVFDGQRGQAGALSRLNWTSWALGLSMVGLEVGYIFMYRGGWKISVASLLSNMLLAVALLLVGLVFYHERLGARQISGLCLCAAGCLLLLTARE